MNDAGIKIERLVASAISEPLVDQLGELLVDAVDSGAAVSFMAPLRVDIATDWWRETLSGMGFRTIILVARDARGIVGTVQMQPAWAPNQPHRGEIAKLIVHRRARGAGLGKRLMHAIEAASREAGMRLLTLDAKEGGPAEKLYRRLGWVTVGTIPDFAIDPDGKAMHGTVIFYKRLDGS